VFVDHREVALFGSETVEYWSNTGNADFPFERIAGAINEKGLRGVFTVTRTDNSIYWVDRDGVVRRQDAGYSPLRISTHAVEESLGRANLDNAEAISYVQEGHEFYCLSTDLGTFVYDAATQLWHERESYGGSRWRAAGYCRRDGLQYVGDFENGNIYQLDLDEYQDNDGHQVAEMLFPPITNDGERFVVYSVQLGMEGGTADDVQVMLQTSRNGKTWSNEAWRSFGDLGEYEKRAVWRNLGQYRDCHLRFRISDVAKRAVFAAYANIS
jgi:hypothetical protein